MVEDTRYVYGANCTWHGDIHEIDTLNTENFSLPCCPHCKSLLFELPSKDIWDNNVKQYMSEHPEYPYYDKFVEAWKGKCMPLCNWDFEQAYKEFEERYKKENGL